MPPIGGLPYGRLENAPLDNDWNCASRILTVNPSTPADLQAYPTPPERRLRLYRRRAHR